MKDFWEENKVWICFFALSALIAFLVGGYFFKKNETGMRSNETLQIGARSPKDEASVSSFRQREQMQKTNASFFVDIKGAVRKPGVYKASEKMRVADIVDAAGGFEKTADHNQVNLALKLTDQQVIYIPFKGEIDKKPPTTMDPGQQATGDADVSATSGTNEISGIAGQDKEKMDLNKVTKNELLEVNGIGDKKADLILAYRTQHGRFEKIEDLKNITGIGDKTFEKLNESLTVGP